MKPDALTLHAVLDCAGRLLPQYAGRRAPHWELLPDGSISVTRAIITHEQLNYALQHSIVCFGFFPTDANLVVIDIDKGHSNGVNGFSTLAERLPEIYPRCYGLLQPVQLHTKGSTCILSMQG